MLNPLVKVIPTGYYHYGKYKDELNESAGLHINLKINSWYRGSQNKVQTPVDIKRKTEKNRKEFMIQQIYNILAEGPGVACGKKNLKKIEEKI